jgi:hypothetical protein
MITWIDEPTWVLVEVNATGVYLTDPRVGRWPFYEASPAMVEAWVRFCARHPFSHSALDHPLTPRPALELTAGPS